MTLGELIKALEAQDPELVLVHGFLHPHSHRGNYSDRAFEPTANVPVKEVLSEARRALGATFTGYKGGDFLMGEWTDVFLANYGEVGEELGQTTLLLIFAEALSARDAHLPMHEVVAGLTEIIEETL